MHPVWTALIQLDLHFVADVTNLLSCLKKRLFIHFLVLLCLNSSG